MKILHVISGGEVGGSREHVISLLKRYPRDQVTLLVFQEGQLLDEAKTMGIEVLLFKQKSRYDISVLSNVAKYINKKDFEIIHSHGPRANLFCSLIRNRIKSKWVITLHSDPGLDFMKKGLKGKLFSWLNKNSLKKADLILAVSERFKEMVVNFGIPSKKVTTIFNGIEFNTDSLISIGLSRSDFDLEDTDFVIAMVARLHPVKGHNLVFKAIQKIKDNSSIKLLLVGDGPLNDELRHEVSKLKLENNVKFLGFRKDVSNILKLVDISILASFSESFPLVLLESARVKVPIISTDVGGVSNLIDSKEKGWLIPINKVDALTNAFQEAILLKEQGKLRMIGENLYNHASQNFSIEHLYREVNQSYKSLLK